MYFHIGQLVNMLSVYNNMDCIGEILVINNDKDKAIPFQLSKVKTIGNGENLFVNPSWKYGVKNAKFENIIIANDDITIKGDLTKLLNWVGALLKDDRIFGPGASCFPKYRNGSDLKIRQSYSVSPYIMNYGFGTFMIMKKETFLNTIIPEDFLVWYGDHFLYLNNEPWEFEGIEIITAMAGTTSKLNLRYVKKKERAEWKKYL